MSGVLTPSAWVRLVNEDIEWLIKKSPDSAERHHIEQCLIYLRDNKPKQFTNK